MMNILFDEDSRTRPRSMFVVVLLAIVVTISLSSFGLSVPIAVFSSYYFARASAIASTISSFVSLVASAAGFVLWAKNGLSASAAVILACALLAAFDAASTAVLVYSAVMYPGGQFLVNQTTLDSVAVSNMCACNCTLQFLLFISWLVACICLWRHRCNSRKEEVDIAMEVESSSTIIFEPPRPPRLRLQDWLIFITAIFSNSSFHSVAHLLRARSSLSGRPCEAE